MNTSTLVHLINEDVKVIVKHSEMAGTGWVQLSERYGLVGDAAVVNLMGPSKRLREIATACLQAADEVDLQQMLEGTRDPA